MESRWQAGMVYGLCCSNIMAVQQFLSELFEATPNYSLPCALGKLRAYGGISSLFNSLAIDHRQTADLYRHRRAHSIRRSERAGSFKQGPKRVDRRQPQLQGILLYLIALSFFVKLLLFDNGLQSSLNIFSQVISFLFVIFILAEKKSRTKAEIVERAPEENEDQRRFRVRRGGNEHSCPVELLQQGDIVQVKEGDCLRFDAILLDVLQGEGEEIVVNEEEVGAGRSKCTKCSVWKVQEAEGLQIMRDPFLLAGSKVLNGTGWVLVCVGSKGRRGSETQVGGLLQLSNASRQVQHVMRVAVVALVGWVGAALVHKESIGPYQVFLQLVYLISCLTLYLSYASTAEFLACLKKYLRQRVHGKGYRVLNHKLLQRLGEVDLVIIEDDCLSWNAELLSKINHLVDMKIVTASPPSRLQGRFGVDLNPETIFQPKEGRLLREDLELLSRCKFIRAPYNQFRDYYLQVLKDLRYNMVYISRSRAAIGRHQQLVTIKCSDLEGAASGERLQGEWVRISQGFSTEEVLMDIMDKATIYKRFQQSFYAIVINNCLELLMLFAWAITGCLVDLNLNLLVVFLNRNRVRQFYEGVAGQAGEGRSRMGLWGPVEVNLIFLIYYIYMSWEISHSNNREFQLFLLLMTNRMFRIQALLREAYHPGLVYRLLKKSLIIVTLILLEAFMKWELGLNSDVISESLDTLLLPLILLLFTLFL